MLGDQMGNLPLRNVTIDEVLEASDGYPLAPSAKVVNMIWAQTNAGATLRRLFMDIYANSVPASFLQRHIGDLDADFLQELVLETLKKLEKASEKVAPGCRKECECHEHDLKYPKCELPDLQLTV